MTQRRHPFHRLPVLALFLMLAACSGGSSGSDSNTGSTPPGSSSPPEAIEGVATPSSVSVVTATNAS